jgi:hypothetical protein
VEVYSGYKKLLRAVLKKWVEACPALSSSVAWPRLTRLHRM